MTAAIPAGLVELRPVEAADTEMLVAVYASTRAAELAAVPWSDSEKDDFVRLQFADQDRHYRTHFPSASYGVLLVDGEAVGRLYVDRQPDELRILDIALLPPARNAGIGTVVLRSLVAEADAAGVVVRIHVEVANAARRLYHRLGFVPAGEHGAYLLMEHPCGTSQP